MLADQRHAGAANKGHSGLRSISANDQSEISCTSVLTLVNNVKHDLLHYVMTATASTNYFFFDNF